MRWLKKRSYALSRVKAGDEKEYSAKEVIILMLILGVVITVLVASALESPADKSPNEQEADRIEQELWPWG